MPIRVLHIEDALADALILRELFAEAGAEYELTRAERLIEGFARLEKDPIDVVLLDLSLPDSRGLETFKKLHDKFPHVPTIVLSGLGDEAAARQTVQAGAQDYFCKDELTTRGLTRAIGYAIERHRADEALERERRLLRAIIDSLPDQIYVKDRKSRFIACNPAVAKMQGFETPDALLGKTDFDLFPRPQAEKFFTEESGVFSGKPQVNREERIVDRDGVERWMLITKVPMLDDRGEVVGLVGINRDISERKRAEDKLVKAMAEMKRAQDALKSTQLQLIHAEKLETLGRLAASVAHETKNPLAVAVMGLEYLRNALGAEHTAQPIIREITDSIKRADTVVSGLLDFSRPRTLILKSESLAELIAEALKLVKHEFGAKRINVTFTRPIELPALKLDANKIKQVFINIFLNAVQAMPENGALVVQTFVGPAGRLRFEDAQFRAPKFSDSDFVAGAHVEDSGSGIKQEHLDKIFEPFFTTKPAGQGTGLGLPVVKQIVEMHGGVFDLRNRTAGGARATVVFAIATKERETSLMQG